MRRVVALVVLLLAAGCGAVAGDALPFVGSGSPAYLCHNTEIPLDALEEGPPATELGSEGQAALEGTEVPPPAELGDLAEWTIVEETDEELVIVREIDEPSDRGDGMVFTHRRLSVERFGPEDADGRPGWHLRSSGECDLQRDLGRLRPGDVELDPGMPASSDLALLVTERACASGQTADDRVRLVDLEETHDEVRLVIGVRPPSGDQSCPSNPPTPFTVELDEPLGDRALLDASVYPHREIGPAQ